MTFRRELLTGPLARMAWALTLISGLGLGTGWANENADPVEGRWLTEKGKVAVELTPCGNRLCGKIVWLAKPHWKSGELRRDHKNADPALRDRPWCGITVITGLKRKKRGVWEGGEFYFPKDGRSYDFEIQREGTALKVRAYLGIKFLGKKETWSRIDEPLPDCVTEG